MVVTEGLLEEVTLELKLEGQGAIVGGLGDESNRQRGQRGHSRGQVAWPESQDDAGLSARVTVQCEGSGDKFGFNSECDGKPITVAV